MTGSFFEQYKSFLDRSKTEFETAEEVLNTALEHGFIPYPRAGTSHEFRPGDRLIQNIRGKGLVLAVVGRRPIKDGAKIAAAHMDSPRLDLKPLPIQEDGGLIYLKTHYYGGIKKYQWACVPLALHGRVADEQGSIKTVSVGEKDGEPVFVITDLAPHLAGQQLSRPGDILITGEQLRLLCGISGSGGLGEEKAGKDFKSLFGTDAKALMVSEFEAVPAWKARDAGLDGSFIAAYGQDDRICVFAALKALLETEEIPEYTCMLMLSDHEEVGSENGAGLYSNAFLELLHDLAEYEGTNLYRVFANTECISADTVCGYDPLYPDVTDIQNTARPGGGMALVRYTGRGGKKGNSSADTGFMTRFASMLDGNGIKWQCGEMGICDAGGGTTVAKCMARWGADVLDIGCAILSMHSPLEMASKADLLSLYMAIGAFFGSKDKNS